MRARRPRYQPSRLSELRGVAQPGSARRSGRRGPRFESGRPDFGGHLVASGGVATRSHPPVLTQCVPKARSLPETTICAQDRGAFGAPIGVSKAFPPRTGAPAGGLAGVSGRCSIPALNPPRRSCRAVCSGMPGTTTGTTSAADSMWITSTRRLTLRRGHQRPQPRLASSLDDEATTTRTHHAHVPAFKTKARVSGLRSSEDQAVLGRGRSLEGLSL
jgi:hypothetical protein